MNIQESQSLQIFLDQLVQARNIVKDPQAEGPIARAAAQQPDAVYLLVQRAMLMEQALNAAKVQIHSLQNQLTAAQTPPARGFLDAEAWGSTPGGVSRPIAGATNSPIPMQPAAMAPPPAAASPGFFGGGLAGTLGTVAATAAGVAGGAFLFQGIEHMLHPSSGAGFMNQSAIASMAPPVENTTVNNYYGEASVPDVGTGGDDFLTGDANWDDGSV